MDIASFITSLSIPMLGINWIDIIIFAILIFYAFEGYAQGFLIAFVDLIAFSLSFLLGITFYSRLAYVLVNTFSISLSFANALGFFIAAALAEIILSFILKNLIANVPLYAKEGPKEKTLKGLNQYLGIIPGAMSGLILSAFILSLIITLPFSVFLKTSVSDSKIGNYLVSNTQGFAKSWSDIFGGAVNDTLSFLTVEPKSSESVNLNFNVKNVTVDKIAEQEMLNRVNKERAAVNLPPVIFSEDLAKVGRNHCKDMFVRGYFSHYTPEKLSPFDRILNVSISFSYAGENLALAPNVELAMKGLMQSEGHRANILSQNFAKLGVGVIDGGVYGQMYCQEFTD
ncbi:MAG: CvpA family protein [Patescibacteria group bacterium]